MAIPKITGAQRDFSAGELDESMKRADENPLMKLGARQASNWRVINGGAISNRSGRTPLFLETGRVEKLLMSPGNVFYLAFGNIPSSGYATLKVYNAAGTQVSYSVIAGVSAPPWSTSTLNQIVWATPSGAQYAIYICYPGGAPNNVPFILSWDGVSQTSTWTLTSYAETITAGGQKRTAFYRISPPNVTMLPSGTSGNINILFSSPILVSGMVGTRMRFCNQQILITGVSSSTAGTATVLQQLPSSEVLTLSGSSGTFAIGDEVTGATSGALGIVVALGSSTNPQQVLLLTKNSGLLVGPPVIGSTLTGESSGATGIVVSASGSGDPWTGYVTVSLGSSTQFSTGETVSNSSGGTLLVNLAESPGSVNTLTVQLLPTSASNIAQFEAETVVGPTGSGTISGVATGSPLAVSVWDDEVMNTFRGYPTSVFYDQNRLGFCNIPSVPAGIIWSAIGLPTDLYTGATADESIFELAPGKSQVFFVQPGMESSEFVFCNNAVYYIPINVSNPLVPGSVSFNLLSEQGCLPNVKPQPAEQSIVYVKAGGLQIAAVQAPGAYYRPYVVDNISEFHSHLFTASAPIAIAIPSGGTQFEELYAYILLANGNLVVGKYAIRQGLLDVGPEGKPKVGWLPWTGAGTTTWISAQSTLENHVIFTTSYAPNNVTPVSIVEKLDNTQYLDGALLVNNLPAPFAPPSGKGPLYNFPGPNSTVTLMDNGTRMMGTYNVDANGNIVPQNNGGENLASAQLVAGQPWTATLEPFVPDAPPGQSQHQRMFKRRVSRMAVYVSNSTGFLMARLFSGPLTRTSPALGTIMNIRRVETWNQDDDPTQPPPLREEAQRWRPLGRAYDPRVAVIKDTPGPLLIHEIGIEASI